MTVRVLLVVRKGLLALHALLVAVILLMASVPLVEKDELVHHLAVPKLYLKHGRMVEMPDKSFSYYPMNIDLLYLLPLAGGWDVAAKWIHAAFGFATAYLIHQHLKRRLGGLYALFGSLLFLCLPIIVKLSTTAYVDLGMTFFITASLLALLRWHAGGYPWKLLTVAALCLGLALGCKYSALAAVPLLSCAMLFLAGRPLSAEKQAWGRILVQALLFFTVTIGTVSPWLLRNHQWTGNPIHPLYGHLFRQAGQPPSQPSSGEEREENLKPTLTHVIYRHMVFGESFAAIAALPLRIFFQGRDGDPALFDGRLNPVLLPLCLAALGCLVGRRHDRSLRTEVFLLFCFSWLYIIIGAFAVDMRVRYILPAMPSLVLLSAYGLHVIVACIREAAGRWRKVLGSLVLVAGVILGSLWSGCYVLELYTRLEPWPVLTGAVTREAYIDRFRFEQPAIRYINQHLRPDAVVLFQFIGGRGYYCDREYRLGDGVFASLLSRSGSSQEVAGMLHGMGITHLLVQRVFFDRWNRQALTPDQQARLERFFHECTRKLFSRNQTEVIELAPQA